MLEELCADHTALYVCSGTSISLLRWASWNLQAICEVARSQLSFPANLCFPWQKSRILLGKSWWVFCDQSSTADYVTGGCIQDLPSSRHTKMSLFAPEIQESPAWCWPPVLFLRPCSMSTGQIDVCTADCLHINSRGKGNSSNPRAQMCTATEKQVEMCQVTAPQLLPPWRMPCKENWKIFHERVKITQGYLAKSRI